KKCPKPKGQEREKPGKYYVCAGEKPFSIGHEIECLQAKRGKCGITAAHPGHEKLQAKPRFNQPSCFRARHGGKESDDERAADVHQKSTPWKGLAKLSRDDAGKPIAPNTAERSTDCHP